MFVIREMIGNIGIGGELLKIACLDGGHRVVETSGYSNLQAEDKEDFNPS